MSAKFRNGALLAAAMLLASCALPGQEREAVTTYLLEWGGPVETRPAPVEPCAAVLVTAPLSAPGFATSRMAYTQQDHRVDYFAIHRWADTPARMLSPLLARALQTSGLFKAAVESPAPINAQLRLQTEVLELLQVFTPQDSAVRLSLKANLFDLTNDRLIASRVLSVTQPAPTRDPYGGVIAANRAVDRLFRELADFLTGVMASDPLDCR